MVIVASIKYFISLKVILQLLPVPKSTPTPNLSADPSHKPASFVEGVDGEGGANCVISTSSFEIAKGTTCNQ